MVDKRIIRDKRQFLNQANPAADLVRAKLNQIYAHEPDAVEEAVEVSLEKKLSKHQQYMKKLTASGQSIASIQTAWHQYYESLNNSEKLEVWNEFYDAQKDQSAMFKKAEAKAERNLPSEEKIISPQQSTPPLDLPSVLVNIGEDVSNQRHTPSPNRPKSVEDIKKQITSKVKVRGKISRAQHLKSIGFGLACGALVVLILLFGFFNERFIAPFITPSRNVSATPLILDPNSASVDASPQIIIPKINAQGPVVYDVPTIEEAAVQTGLERGIVHYATTPNPGEQGNAVFFGHSSGNILNRGKYKFIFVLLSWLEPGDTFYVQKDGVRYVYKVTEKKIVRPNEVGVLGPVEGKTATATLITCDPPGTNVNRLVVIGEQVSPDPSKNVASSVDTSTVPSTLAGNSESLWHRLTSFLRR